MPSNITKFGSLKGSDEHKQANKGRFGLVSTELHSVPPASVGEHLYYIPGAYTWVAPVGAGSVCVVCVGGGGGAIQHDFYGLPFAIQGGGGGTLAYLNNFPVVAGQGYDLYVGAGGTGLATPSGTSNVPTTGQLPNFIGGDGGDSWFNNTTTCKAGGGKGGKSGLFTGNQLQSDAPVGTGGGRGGFSSGFSVGHFILNGITGGGGAGGYNGDGSGYTQTGPPGTYDGHPSATSGAGAAGYPGNQINTLGNENGGPGGGVGVYGTGPSGSSHGESGSLGRNAGLAPFTGAAQKGVYSTSASGWDPTVPPSVASGSPPHNNSDQVQPGLYGGGGGNSGFYQTMAGPGLYKIYGSVGNGGNGAVRIIWGPGRSFPSTLVTEADSNANVTEN